jgi:magnesium chelatase subunit H
MTLNRTMRADATPVRIVIVTLDNHLSGTAERVQARFAREQPGTTIAFHAAADWESIPGALAQCREDIATGDIIICTMLFLEDQIKAVLPALQARRDACDAMVCLMSSGDIVKLTKLGAYDMSKPATGPLAILKRLRGSSKPGQNSGAGQMKMLRRLPKILRFIPGTAQDVRTYFLTLQYWLAGSDENFANMILNLVDRYADGPRKAMRGETRVAAPQEYPEVGVYHPRMKGRMTEQADRIPVSPSMTTGTVGLLLLRSYVLGNDTGHYDGVIAAMEAKGLRVIPAFASGLDSRPAVETFFMKDGVATVDAVVSLTGFSLVGGPAYNDADAAADMLAKLDRPYIAAHPLEFQTLQHWGAGTQGLLPLESTIMVSIPELDGAAVPSVFGGRSDGSDAACTGCSRGCVFEATGLTRAMQPCVERAEALAAKTAKLVAMRTIARANRKVGIVLFNFPPNAGAAGTAAFLSVFESLYATLVTMKAEGYSVDTPESVDALRDLILKGNSERFGTDANVYARIATDDHVRRETHLDEIEGQWGPAPGRQLADGSGIQILGAQFGNVFVGLQPSFGYEGDPMRLLFEGRFTPTHAFSAFYRYLREDFGADAVLHFGTHGALEFMPGKQVGLTGDCWPERLIGDLPNFYLYAANNPSEAMIAKRRSGATLISYLTPAIAKSGLYKGLADVKASIDRWRSSPPDAVAERASLLALIRDQADAIDLTLAEGDDANSVRMLADKLYEIEESLIPHGLHVAGQAETPEARVDLLHASCEARGQQVPTRLSLELLVGGDDKAFQASGLEDCFETRLLFKELAETNAKLSVNGELDAIITALDGRYIRPVAGGDVIRNPDILPTGRNVHGFDPFRIPSAYAVKDGADQAAKVLDRHLADTGELPESVAMVLWGTDNLKSEGAQIAQALALIGARPRFDSYGRLAGAELISLEELGRPRIDAIVTLSGIFRDLLPLQTRMLAEAAFLASEADEALEMNFVRKHTLQHQATHDCDLETAALRVFSNNEGAYGANVNQMIDASCWTDEAELADSFERQKGFAYGRNGRAQKQGALLKSALAGVDFAYQNLESVELGVTTIDHYVDGLGGIARSITRAKGEAAPIYISDQTQGGGKVRTLGEQVALETRTRTLNPSWFEGMLKHGGEGVRQIEGQVMNCVGWSATTGDVDPWIYQRITETYVLDPEMRDRMAALNPKASMRVANRLIEASDRKYWSPDAATLAALYAATDAIEDRLEGIAA